MKKKIESISIYNVLGELLQVNASSSFSVENLAKGTYFLNVKTTDGSVVKRLVKE